MLEVTSAEFVILLNMHPVLQTTIFETPVRIKG